MGIEKILEAEWKWSLFHRLGKIKIVARCSCGADYTFEGAFDKLNGGYNERYLQARCRVCKGKDF
ncbi:MAG: hypothetical protein QME12_03665 [Nanoarchaeota archaeon]|nr:hypothetical protein [Nanoarchaeota archaeon]